MGKWIRVGFLEDASTVGRMPVSECMGCSTLKAGTELDECPMCEVINHIVYLRRDLNTLAKEKRSPWGWRRRS